MELSTRRLMLHPKQLIGTSSAAVRSAAKATGDMYVCNFCHEFRDYVAKGPDVCICEVCVAAIGSDNEMTWQDRCSFCHQRARTSKWRFRERRIVLIGT